MKTDLLNHFFNSSRIQSSFGVMIYASCCTLLSLICAYALRTQTTEIMDSVLTLFWLSLGIEIPMVAFLFSLTVMKKEKGIACIMMSIPTLITILMFLIFDVPMPGNALDYFIMTSACLFAPVILYLKSQTSIFLVNTFAYAIQTKDDISLLSRHTKKSNLALIPQEASVMRFPVIPSQFYIKLSDYSDHKASGINTVGIKFRFNAINLPDLLDNHPDGWERKLSQAVYDSAKTMKHPFDRPSRLKILLMTKLMNSKLPIEDVTITIDPSLGEDDWLLSTETRRINEWIWRDRESRLRRRVNEYQSPH
ncbi:hypothetical protein AB6D11_19105 [Vibrio splendidus]